MKSLVAWTGPVSTFQVPESTVPGAHEIFFPCCGNLAPPCVPPTCPTLGDGMRSDPALLLDAAGITRAELGDLFLAGFSAGGSLIKRLLTNKSYRDLTTAVHLADATYTSVWQNPSTRTPPAIEGFVSYGVDVVQSKGKKLFIATASPVPNGQWASGVENLRAIRLEIERQTGLTFSERSDFFGVTPGPERLYQLGNVLLAEYPQNPLGHGHTKISDQIWRNIIQPWVAQGKGLLDGAGDVPRASPLNGNLSVALSIAAGAAMGFGLVKLGSRFVWGPG